jgi:cell division septal protein FtsQ
MARSVAAPAPRRLGRRGARPAFAGVPRPLSAAARLPRAGIAFAWERRSLRIALIAVLIAIPLLGGGWWLARHSSLTAVEHVHVSGLGAVHGTDTAAIESALRNTADGMSTLGVSPAALRAAVAQYPIVRSVRAHASFPHGLRIEVIEQPPVAALVENGARTAVAADGVVLGPGYLSSTLGLVNAAEPGAGAAAATGALPATGASVHGSTLLQALSILGAAPGSLLRTVTRVYSGPRGLTVVLRSGLLAYFGDGTRPHAKWIALTRVLADPSSAGAVYIDVRLPERATAGFAPGTARAGAGSTETESAGGSDPATAAELAAGLDAAVGGGSSSSSSATATATTTTTGSSSAGEPAPSGSAAPGTASATGAGSASEATSASPSEPGTSGETPAG